GRRPSTSSSAGATAARTRRSNLPTSSAGPKCVTPRTAARCGLMSIEKGRSWFARGVKSRGREHALRRAGLAQHCLHRRALLKKVFVRGTVGKQVVQMHERFRKILERVGHFLVFDLLL